MQFQNWQFFSFHYDKFIFYFYLDSFIVKHKFLNLCIFNSIGLSAFADYMLYDST